MNNENSPFDGFSDPNQFYKHGHSWFDLWTKDLKGYGSTRRSLLIITDYLIKNEWIIEKTGKQGCSSLEIKKGFVHPSVRKRFDQGTQLDARVIKKVLQILVEKEIVIEVEQQDKSYFRVNRHFFPEIFVNDNLSDSSKDNGGSTFFKVPNSAFELYKQTGSLAVILVLEYFFRHSWGYKNYDGVWLTAEEFQNGRKYSNGERYDDGIGFDKTTIYDALKECCSKGWIVVECKKETGYSADLYNLCFKKNNDNQSSNKSLIIESGEQYSGIQTKKQNCIEKTFEDYESNCKATAIDSDYRIFNWVVNDAMSGVNADTSWAIAYSSWLNAKPDWVNVTTISDENGNVSGVDADISCVSAYSSCVDVNDFCESVEELLVKETSNTQLSRNQIETTTSNQTDNFDQTLAVAVVNGNQKEFLLSIGIVGSPIDKILGLNLPDEYLFGWALFNSTDHNCRSKSDNGFIVNRLKNRDSPDYDCLSIGRLNVRDWIELMNAFIHHYSMSSSYIPEELEQQANYLRAKIFLQRDSKLPTFLDKFTKNIHHTQEEQYE